MADIDTDNPLRQAQFIGIDNRNPETKVRPGHVREALNVLTTRDGQMPQRRDGYAKAFFTGGSVHSLWGDGVFPYALFVSDGVMYGLSEPGGTPFPIHTQMAADHRVSYAPVNDRVYWSNGVQSGMVTTQGENFPWACEAPAGQPDATPLDSGGMDAGAYQYAITYRDALGRESGTPRAGVVSVVDGGGFSLTHLPTPVGDSVITLRLYVSEANGDTLRHAHDFAPGATSVTVRRGERHKPLATLLHEPLPPGHMVGSGHGRLYVARGRGVYWSEALYYGQGVVRNSYVRFGRAGDRVDLLAPVTDAGGSGVFVAAGKRTYFLRGPDPAAWSQHIAYPYGAVPGTLCWASGEVWGVNTTVQVPAWLATNGQFCVGLANGEVASFNASVCAADTGEYGASMLRDVAGQRQMVTTLRGPVSQAGFSDRVAVTVCRNGVMLP